MTVTEAKQKWVQWLKDQVGVTEEGDNIVHKYFDGTWDNQFYGFEMNGQPWCDAFADYSYIANFGMDIGKRMTYQMAGGSAGCALSASYYQQYGAYFNFPEVGDQIFFYVGGGINHTGCVVGVDDNNVYTIEGNSSDAVRQRTYSLHDSKIAGYGRPKWSLTGETEASSQSSNETQKSEITYPDEVSSDGRIHAGDLVKIINGAVWYTGATIPVWAYGMNWFVKSVNGTRAVLNHNEAYTRQIMSPIDTKYLEVVQSQYETTTEEQVQSVVSESEAVSTNTENTYTVQRGDSLWAISQKYLGQGYRYKEIKEANNLTSDIIYPGQVLIIPNN